MKTRGESRGGEPAGGSKRGRPQLRWDHCVKCQKLTTFLASTFYNKTFYWNNFKVKDRCEKGR